MIILFKRKLISTSRWKGGSEMRRWPLSVFVFLLVATALLLAGGAAAQTPCDAADKLFKLQLYDAAQTNYTDLLNKDPTLTCAQNGSLEVQHAEARNLYEQGLAFEKANQVDAAKTAYVEALKKDPNFSNATVALARMNGGGLRNILNLVYNWLTPYVEFVAVILIFILLIRRIFPWIMGFCKPRIDILEFDKGGTSLDIGKGMKAMVEEKIKWFDKKSHTHHGIELVTGPIEKIVIPAEMKSVSPPIKIMSDLIEWLSPSNVITLSGYMETQGNQGVGVTLSLVKSQTGEIIASQTLWQEEFDPTWTLSSAKENTPEPYYHLVEPIATWIVFNLNISPLVKNGIFCKLLCSINSLYDRFIRVIKRNPIGHAEDFNILNTKVWQSYAYFRAGFRWASEGNFDNARKMYLKALNEDPKNVGALLNLGIRYSIEKDYRRALDLLKQVKELRKPDAPEDGFVWYIGTYQLAITYYYMAKQYRESIKTADEKVSSLKKTIIEMKKQKNNDAALKCYLLMARKDEDILFENIKTNKDIVEILLEDSLLDAEKLKNDDIELREIETNLKIVKNDLEDMILSNAKNIRETIYDDLFKKIDAFCKKNNNLIFDSNMKKAEIEATELCIATEEDAKKVMGMKSFLNLFKPLADCFHLEIQLENKEKKKEDIDKLVKSIKSSEYIPEVHYNLACCYSVAGEKDEENSAEAYEKALLHLKYALELRKTYAQEAQKDPSLKGVREDEKTKAEFKEIIKKYGGPQNLVAVDSLPLAGIAIIGEAYAKQLKENEIVSYCDLILKADTPQAREALAKNLGISTQLLHRWALLADLMRIVGNTQNANLLEEAGVDSLKALQNVSDPCELANLLNQINKAISLVSQTTSTETVRQWVQEAKKTELKVH